MLVKNIYNNYEEDVFMSKMQKSVCKKTVVERKYTAIIYYLKT